MRMRVSNGKSYEIHGRQYNAGEEFDAPEKEAALWKAIGLAEDAEPAPVVQLFKRPVRPRKVESEAAHYERKDMRAEESDD